MKLYKVKTVIVTGIEHKISDEVTKINNLIAADDEVFCVSCEKTGGSYSGTGDLFASVVFSGLLRGDSLKDTVNLAVKFIQTSLCETVKLGIHRNEVLNLKNI